MASKNTALVKLVGDNHDLRKALQDSERRVKGLEKAVARTRNNTKGAFSPLTESALKSLGPLGKLTMKLHGVAGEMRTASSQAKKTGDDVHGMGGKFDGLNGKFGKLGGLAKGMAGPLAAAGAALGGIVAAGELLSSSINKLKALAGETRKLKRETGMSAEQASAWIAIGDRMGVTSSQLSQSFGIFSKKMQSGNKDFGAAIAELGVAQSTMESGNFDQMLTEIANGFKSMPAGANRTALALQLFGRGGKALLPILIQGGSGLAKLKDEMAALGLTIGDKTLEQTKELTKAQKTLNQLWDGLQIQLATKIVPSLSDAAVKAKDFAMALRTGKTEPGTFADNLRGLKDTIGDVISTIGDFLDLPILGSLYKFSNPVLRFGQVMKFVFEGGIARAASSFWKFLSGTAGAIGGWFMRVVRTIARLPGRFVDIFVRIIRYIGSLPSRFGSVGRRAAVGLWRGITGVVTGLPGWMNKTIGRVISTIGGLGGRVRNVAVRLGRSILSGLRSGVGSLWGVVKGPLQSAINGVIRGINWMIGKANSLLKNIPGKVRGALGIGTIGKLPEVRLAQGGIVRRATVAMIGEAGPEAVIPLSPGKRGRAQALYAQAGQMLGVNSGHSMTFNVVNNGNQLDEQALASKLAWQLQTRGI